MFKILSDEEIELRLRVGLLKPSPRYYYQVYLKGTDDYIGNVGINLGQGREFDYLGNIEYEIFPKYRGNNYAEKASRLLVIIAQYYNVENLKITCNPQNTASLQTIQKLGCRFIEVIKVPERTKLYEKGNKEVFSYCWNIKEKTKKER